MLFAGKLTLKTRVFLVIAAFAVLILLFYSGLGLTLYGWIHSLGLLGIVLIGAFYTFGLTTPTAFVIILKSMSQGDYLMVAFVASASATIVDTLLFMAVKDQLEKSASELMKSIHNKVGSHNLIFPTIGFFLFGSPLPDELALASMQIGDIRPAKVSAIIFLAKFLILLLAYKTLYGI
ncbi:MAG: hypothetical protein KGH74_04570 [Candidatus Micrarchaeota archaeon]|nr:hypothetical protein [Candidatus Micrarchaeota archaeon]